MAASSLIFGQPSATGQLLAGNQLDVICNATGMALIERFLPDGSTEKTPVGAGLTVSLGEFQDAFTFRVTCFSGSLTYEQVRSTASVVEALGVPVLGVAGNLTTIPANTHLTLPENTQAVIYDNLTVNGGSYTANGELRIL